MVLAKKKIIFDTDPGIDDAVALFYLLNDASVSVELMTTVSGNVSIENVTNNALRLLSFYDKEIPVAKGASQPLVRQSESASNIHGETGLAGFHYENKATNCLLKESAVDAMYRLLTTATEKITLVAVGPLMNIAMLIETYPECLENIEEIIIMGGAIGRGNYGVYTEFNIGFDPEAAKIVFNSGIKLTMIGLEMGDAAVITSSVKDYIQNLNIIGETFVQMFNEYRGEWVKNDTQIYDATAIAYLLKPELFEVKFVFADVETKGEYTSGATICDLDGILNQQPNVYVATAIDPKGFEKWFVECIENYS